MASVANLSFNGCFEQGFSLTLYIQRDNGISSNLQLGKLSPNPIIIDLYEQWWTSFLLLINHARNWDDLKIDESLPSNVEVFEAKTKQQKVDFCRKCWQKLQAEMKHWLESSETDLTHIQEALKQEFSTHHESRLLILAEDTNLWKLPWLEWQLLKDYGRVGISFSLPNIGNLHSDNFDINKIRNSEDCLDITVSKKAQSLWCVFKSFPKYLESYFLNKKSVNILAVLGNDTCQNDNDQQAILNLQEDKNEIQQLEGALPEFLDKPTSRFFIQKLRQKNDILFFAGHSGNGHFQINDQETLAINEFNFILKDAIIKGLKIAIFNSCDGLNLAIDMLRLNLPFSIVMQENIPDVCAYSFLKEFLLEYQSGTSLPTSIRLAQQRLQNPQLPGVELLPTLIQIPVAIPPTYQQLRKPFLTTTTIPKLSQIFAVSLGLTILLFSLRWWGHLQPLELNAYDSFIQQQMVQKKDENLLVIRVTPQDIKWLNQPPEEAGQGARTLSDTTINNLLTKLEPFQPQIIGLDIFREGEINDKYAKFKSSLEKGNLISVCNGNIDDNIEGISAPSNALKDNIGFADLALDQDNVIRRNILYMNLDNPKTCQTRNAVSFSFKLAEKYLENQGILRTDKPEDDFIKLGDAIFPPLKFHQGGYHHQEDKNEVEGGIQIMVNYNNFKDYQKVVPNFTLQEVFEDKILADDVQNRIVLIGKDFPTEDRSLTPFHNNIPNVFLHAQMVKNILDVVDNKKSVIWNFPWWIDTALIWFLSLQGGAIAFIISLLKLRLNNQNFLLILSIIGAIIYSLIHIIYLSLFTIKGLWLPLIPSYLAIFMTIIGILASQSILQKTQQ